MDDRVDLLRHQTRRAFLGKCGAGLGAIALAALEREASAGGAGPLAPRATHYLPKAKRVLFLHMTGGPPQQELFDFKPKLRQMTGQPCPDDLTDGERFAFIRGVPKLLGTPYRFRRHGESGAWVSELLPNLARQVDDLCIVKSMYTDEFNHAPAQMFLFTGSPRLGRPSMGSWVTYGLGSENQDLPGFVVLVSGGYNPSAGRSLWGSGFIPSVYQGVQCRSAGDPILFLSDPNGVKRRTRRATLDAIGDLNRLAVERSGDPETRTRIDQYELAFRMQTAAPEAMDISREPEWVHRMYGTKPGEVSYANNCLLARRLLERDVRFVQLFDWGWDFHGSSFDTDIVKTLPDKARAMDQATGALLTDLKTRGLLDDTLVIWGGEFGRTPMNEERDGSKFIGRDHHPHCFTIFLAGAGVKKGLVYGETDELGYRITEGRTHVHDLQATILHLLGMDHERLVYPYQGRDFRLTDVAGRVNRALLA